MRARLPNLITSIRFLLALIFFVLMQSYRHGHTSVLILDWAFGTFVFTAVTDILDGYLARRWRQESTFGRILDPLVDKVLVIGAFMYLASDHFAKVVPGLDQATHRVVNTSGVAIWMVVLILIRELLVTGLRGFSEAKGMSFKATIPGKIKMFVQCFAVGTAIIVAGHLNDVAWCRHFRDVVLWVMVFVTLFSMLVYMERARALFSLAMRGSGEKTGQDGPPH